MGSTQFGNFHVRKSRATAYHTLRNGTEVRALIFCRISVAILRFQFAMYVKIRVQSVGRSLSNLRQHIDSTDSFLSSGGIDQRTFLGNYRVMAAANCLA